MSSETICCTRDSLHNVDIDIRASVVGQLANAVQIEKLADVVPVLCIEARLVVERSQRFGIRMLGKLGPVLPASLISRLYALEVNSVHEPQNQ